MDTKNKIFVVIGTVAILATAGVGGYTLFTAKDDEIVPTYSGTSLLTPDTANTSTNSNVSSADTTNTAVTGAYKDGTYTATQLYGVPKGSNDITVTVVISSSAISSVTTSHTSSDRESAMYIDSFDTGINAAVVGKSLDEVSANRVGGASLTTDGFNAALDVVRTQASA